MSGTEAAMLRTKISFTSEEGKGTILLEGPEAKPPTLDAEVLAKLENCIDQAAQSSLRLLIIKSTSGRFFCVGANINVLKETNEETIIPWVKKGHDVLNKLEDLPMPVVAVVEGYAMGGGLELAMACDLIFASDSANFAQSEAGLGFIPGWGGTRRLAARIGNSKAKYYFYSGKMIDAYRAADIGLVDFAGTKPELENELKEFTASVITNNSNAITQFKQILNSRESEQRNAFDELELSRSVTCLQDPDTKQRLHDFINKKKKA